MENLALVSPKPLLGFHHHSPESRTLLFPIIRNPSSSLSQRPRYKSSIFALSSSPHPTKQNHNKIGPSSHFFARVSSNSRPQETAKTTTTTTASSVGVGPLVPPPPPPSQFGTPLFWIGVGVGFSALFSWLASYVKKYAMQQAFKTMMGQMGSQSNQFTPPAFSPGSPFPYPPPSTAAPATSFGPTASSQPSTSVPPTASQATVTLDVSKPEEEAAPAAPIKKDTEIKTEPKRPAFVDVSPDDTLLSTPFKKIEDSAASGNDTNYTEGSQNGASHSGTWSGAGSTAGTGAGSGSSSGSKAGFLSVEALEKMMEDPTVQKMVYPYLPEEMRNPATFKWMLQNPVYRQQLQDMLSNMGGSAEWDNRMMDTLKNFDLSSREVKQQFDQIGLTPEEVISKIMANPDVALAFQNPRVQAAIMDCSQNPYNISKYQNDKEVMDVFNKISELFPGITG